MNFYSAKINMLSQKTHNPESVHHLIIACKRRKSYKYYFMFIRKHYLFNTIFIYSKKSVKLL